MRARNSEFFLYFPQDRRENRDILDHAIDNCSSRKQLFSEREYFFPFGRSSEYEPFYRRVRNIHAR